MLQDFWLRFCNCFEQCGHRVVSISHLCTVFARSYQPSLCHLNAYAVSALLEFLLYEQQPLWPDIDAHLQGEGQIYR